jgi:Tol biopolymer transport system component
MDRGGRAGLYRIDAQTGDSELLLERPSGSYVGVPMVAPDGRTLLYKRVDWSQKRYRIMARELGTGRERELLGTTAPVPVGLWEISPGGDDLAYMTSHLRSPIVIRDVGSPRRTETGELFRLKPGQEIGAFAWAARGDSLLIALGSRDRRPKTELWRVRLDGAEPENLGIEMDELRAVSVSPDGRHLALMTEKWKSEVWAMENFLPRPGTPRE